MTRCSQWLVFVLLLATALPGQDERSVLKAGVDALNAYATVALKNGYPRKAKEVWLEVIARYDENDAVARKALGYVKVGRSWAPDPDYTLPAQDSPNAAVAKNLQKRWAKLAKDLGRKHRDLAVALKEAGNEARASFHFERALRFLPGDSVAGEAQGVINYEGFQGTEDEVTLLKRSRLMDRTITALLEQDYPVEELPASASHPYIAKAGIEYWGVKSENFTVWGDWDREVLKAAARNAERALAFCKVAYDGYEGFPPSTGVFKAYAFFKGKEPWSTVLKANPSFFGNRLEFVLQNSSATGMGSGADALRIAGPSDEPSLQDLAVRWVAQSYTGTRSDALTEGIGHAIVGMFFGRNLVFSVGQVDPDGTVAGGADRQRKLLLPDIETWSELAVEFAWQKTGTTSAAELPLLKAASFPDDARIKAWAFSDYLLRRDPRWILALDRTTSKASNSNEVKGVFQDKTKIDLGALEEDWRRFWTEDTPLIRAIRSKVTPLEAASKDAPKWLAAFNEVRKDIARVKADIGWSATYSTACKLHADYLEVNKKERGALAEHTQKPGNKAFTREGMTFAPTALVHVGRGKPEKIIEEWLMLPGYRDAVIDQGLSLVGLYAGKGVVVVDATRGRGRPAASLVYPSSANNRDNPVPASITVAKLGDEVVKALADAGHKRVKEVGTPISFHTYGASNIQVLGCKVEVSGKPVEVVYMGTTPGRSRRTSARGMAVCYPVKAFKRGDVVRVRWDFKDNGQAQNSTFEFHTK